MSVELITAIIGSGAFMSIVTFMFTRKEIKARAFKLVAEARKINAETEKTYIDTEIRGLERIDKGIESFKQMATHLNSTIDGYSKEVKQLKVENRELIGEMAKVNQQNRVLSEDVMKFKSLFERIAAQTEILQEANDTLTNEIRLLRKENVSLKNQIKLLETAINNHNSQ